MKVKDVKLCWKLFGVGLLCLLLGILINQGRVNAAGQFRDSVHTWISNVCVDLYDEPHRGAEHNADPLDLSTFGTANTALNYIPHIDMQPQTSGSPDGWCDLDPTSVALEEIVTTEDDTSIFLFIVPIAPQGMYTVVNVTEASKDFTVSAVIPVPGTTSFSTIFGNKVPKQPGIYAFYWGPANAVIPPKAERLTDVAGASIRPFPDDTSLVLRIHFPKAGTYSLFVVSELAIRPNDTK